MKQAPGLREAGEEGVSCRNEGRERRLRCFEAIEGRYKGCRDEEFSSSFLVISHGAE